MTLTELSIKRPSLVVVLFSVLGILGFFSYLQLQYELLPKMTPPVVSIAVQYPGGAPDEVETSLTKPLEEAVSALEKIETISSISSEGLSVVTVEFSNDADIDLALQDAQRKINEIRDRLPDDAKDPVISKFALDEVPVLRIGAISSLSDTDFYQLLKDNIKPQLSSIDGVGQVYLTGGREREIRSISILTGFRHTGLRLPTFLVQSTGRTSIFLPERSMLPTVSSLSGLQANSSASMS